MITDSTVVRMLDYDSVALVLRPTIDHGLPASVVSWYHNGELLESGVDNLTIPSTGGAVQARDRGIYMAAINNTFGRQSVNYTVIITNC